MVLSAFPGGIYGITGPEFSRGRGNPEVVRGMIQGGICAVQYRDKTGKTALQKFRECLEIRELTRKAGVLFVVNDSADLALACDADGVHVGQTDLPLPAVRKLVGQKIIGMSVLTPEQARKAHEEGADYLGVGPVYATSTKPDAGEPLGLDFLDYCVKNIPLPSVAIGGIKLSNVSEIAARGARAAAIVSEITGAENIAGMAKKLKAEFERGAERRRSSPLSH